jgi:RNA polymerase sigma factor
VEIDVMAVNAKNDDNLTSRLISQHENFILKCASAAARSYISRSDDEWPIALAAFAEAISNYSPNKGSFLNYAELVIRRRIVEYIGGKSRFAPETWSMQLLSDSKIEQDSMNLEAVGEAAISAEENNSLKLEIYLINEILYGHGFSFMDLTDCSPKSKRDKKLCARVVAFVINNPILTSKMKVKRQFPLNLIIKNTRVSRKFLEKHRKYIVTAVEIMSGDYENLSVYMEYISEEIEKCRQL